MTPIPHVAKVEPRCYQCGATDDLILRDGPVICRHCVKVGVRLAEIGAKRPVRRDPWWAS